MIVKKLFSHYLNITIYLGLLFFQQITVFAQDQKVADSLVKIYKTKKLNNSEKQLS